MFVKKKWKVISGITASTALILSLIGSFIPASISPTANASTTISRQSLLDPRAGTFDDYPDAHTEEMKAKVMQIALSDPGVQELVGGKSYSVLALGFGGNIYETPLKRYPELTLNIDGLSAVTITIDLEKGVVTQIGTPYELKKIGPRIEVGDMSPSGTITTDN